MKGQTEMGILIAFIVSATISIFWGGYVTATLWGWFMVPLGVKAITYWHAVGLGALFSVFMGSRGTGNKEEDAAEAATLSIFASAVIPAILLAFGWLAKINL